MFKLLFSLSWLKIRPVGDHSEAEVRWGIQLVGGRGPITFMRKAKRPKLCKSHRQVLCLNRAPAPASVLGRAVVKPQSRRQMDTDGPLNARPFLFATESARREDSIALNTLRSINGCYQVQLHFMAVIKVHLPPTYHRRARQ